MAENEGYEVHAYSPNQNHIQKARTKNTSDIINHKILAVALPCMSMVIIENKIIVYCENSLDYYIVNNIVYDSSSFPLRDYENLLFILFCLNLQEFTEYIEFDKPVFVGGSLLTTFADTIFSFLSPIRFCQDMRRTRSSITTLIRMNSKLQFIFARFNKGL